MSYVIACAASALVGLVLGVALDWQALREMRETIRRQAAILHTDDRTPRHPFTAAGPDDHEARSRVGRRHA